jgi:histone deacetylase complex regulatory component SIN3
MSELINVPFDTGVKVEVEHNHQRYVFTLSANALAHMEQDQMEHLLAGSVYKAFLEFNQDGLNHAKELYELKMRMHQLLAKHPDLIDVFDRVLYPLNK